MNMGRRQILNWISQIIVKKMFLSLSQLREMCKCFQTKKYLHHYADRESQFKNFYSNI